MNKIFILLTSILIYCSFSSIAQEYYDLKRNHTQLHFDKPGIGKNTSNILTAESARDIEYALKNRLQKQYFMELYLEHNTLMSNILNQFGTGERNTDLQLFFEKDKFITEGSMLYVTNGISQKRYGFDYKNIKKVYRESFTIPDGISKISPSVFETEKKGSAHVLKNFRAAVFLKLNPIQASFELTKLALVDIRGQKVAAIYTAESNTWEFAEKSPFPLCGKPNQFIDTPPKILWDGADILKTDLITKVPAIKEIQRGQVMIRLSINCNADLCKVEQLRNMGLEDYWEDIKQTIENADIMWSDPKHNGDLVDTYSTLVLRINAGDLTISQL